MQEIGLLQRPERFDQVIGQDRAMNTVRGFVSKILSGEAKTRFILLSSVTPGVGKTTTGRLIAAALNCSGRDKMETGVEPCGKCSGCHQAFSGGSEMGAVIEINGAKNNGVDDMRALETSLRRSVPERFRVVIVDEAHRITVQGQEAMLKPLEEPTAGVVVIWCTTEENRIIDTIRNRAIPVNFAPVKESVLVDLVKRLSPDVEDSVALAMVQDSHGSVRGVMKRLEASSYDLDGSDRMGFASLGALYEKLAEAVVTKGDPGLYFTLIEKHQNDPSSEEISYSGLLLTIHERIKGRILEMYSTGESAGAIRRMTYCLGVVARGFRDIEQVSQPKIVVDGIVGELIGTDFGDPTRRRDMNMYNKIMDLLEELVED